MALGCESKNVVAGAFLLLISSAFSAEIFTECYVDDDCGPEGYCSNFMCEVCVPCESWLNREPASDSVRRNKCAKSEDDCGSCLPGFQSEDLTSQRRSLKCFPVEKSEAFKEAESMSWTSILIVAAMIGSVCVALATFYFARRNRKASAQDQEKNLNEESQTLVAPSAPYLPPPPPYNLIDRSVDETDRAVRQLIAHIPEQVRLLNAEHVSAAPIGPYHRQHEVVRPEADFELENEDVALNPVHSSIDDMSDDAIVVGGSTETIPSQWEPENVNENESPSQIMTVPSPNAIQMYRVRSVSFQHLPFNLRSENIQNLRAAFARQRSQSDPEILSSRSRRASFAGENYAHRHVRLSSYRLQARNNQNTTWQETNTVSTPESVVSHSVPTLELTFSESIPIAHDGCEHFEADAPSPFAYSDDEQKTNPPSVPFNISLLTAALLHRTNLVRTGTGSPNESPGGGSLDSGFFDTSRRRPVPNEEIDVGISFFVKRRRQDCE